MSIGTCLMYIFRERYMEDWKSLEENITGDEKRKFLNLVKDQLLIGLVKKGESPGDAFLTAADWQDDCYRVVYSRPYRSDGKEKYYKISELIFFGMHENRMSFEFEDDDGVVMVLRGQASIERLNEFINHYTAKSPQTNSPMYNQFFTCGPVVQHPEDIHRSYEVAKVLMGRRFFADPEQHMYDEKTYEALRERKVKPFDEKQFSVFCKNIIDSIQTSNRSMLGNEMEQLFNQLTSGAESEQTVRVLLTELHMRVIGTLWEKYFSSDMHMPDFGISVRHIFEHEYLYEILEDSNRELVSIMHDIGAPSRDSVLSDILYYIQHNLGETLRLEKIAPLFGYNNAYLGKIFKSNVGESFNSYVDRMRIDRAKELLHNDSLKVYEISERVGYKNVDYFHKKFQLYVGMSPAVYRKTVLKNRNDSEK